MPQLCASPISLDKHNRDFPHVKPFFKSQIKKIHTLTEGEGPAGLETPRANKYFFPPNPTGG